MLDEDTLLRVRRAAEAADSPPANEGTPATGGGGDSGRDAGTAEPASGGSTFNNLKDKFMSQLEKLPSKAMTYALTSFLHKSKQST